MNSSEQVNELAEALAELQKDLPVIPKLRTAKVQTKSGGEYTYDYADLSDIMDAIKKLLGDNGLSVVQMPCVSDDLDKDLLTTRVMHKSGQWIESTLRLFVSADRMTPQVFGSAITYFRRYALCAALGIVADADDDGTLAELAFGQGRTRKRKAPSSQQSVQSGESRAGRRVTEETASDLAGKMTAKDRNRVVRALSEKDPPIRDPQAIAEFLNALLQPEEPLTALVELSADQGKILLEALELT